MSDLHESKWSLRKTMVMEVASLKTNSFWRCHFNVFPLECPWLQCPGMLHMSVCLPSYTYFQKELRYMQCVSLLLNWLSSSYCTFKVCSYNSYYIEIFLEKLSAYILTYMLYTTSSDFLNVNIQYLKEFIAIKFLLV